MSLRDDTFYSDYRIFKVEKVLFKVPIDALTAESEVFRDLLKLPPVPSSIEGLSDENPICLDGVLSEDFRQLLKVLCPRFMLLRPATFAEWTSVLKLADLYMMNAVRSHAIFIMDQLSGFDPVEKIVVARRYSIKSWLKPTFNRILQRPQSFTEYDLQRLGAQTVLRLVALRDRLRPLDGPPFGGISGWSLGAKREAVSVDFTQAIEENLSECADDHSESKQSSNHPTLNMPTIKFTFRSSESQTTSRTSAAISSSSSLGLDTV